MKKPVIKLLLFLPLLLFIIAINTTVDPANIFHAGYEETAAQLILSGMNVIGLSNYDERLFQQYAILGATQTPDTVFIGSSRVMEMSKDVSPDFETCWNAGLSGAGIYDYLGIIGLYATKGSIPNRIVIGLDPWILNENNGDVRYKSIAPYINISQNMIEDSNKFFDFFSLRYDLLAARINKYVQILSPSYFQVSIKAIKTNSSIISNRDQFNFSTTEESVSDEAIRYSDGSIDYDLTRRSRTIDEVDAIVKSFLAGDIYQMEDYYTLNRQYKTTLTSLLNFLENAGTEIIIYLPPFHPDVYDYLSSNPNYRMVIESEKYFRNIAEEMDIPVYGSFNPQLTHCENSYFLDGMHLRRDCIEYAFIQTD